MNSQRRVEWEPLISALAIIFTILGVVVPLFVHLDNKTEARLSIQQQEMRDFHQQLLEIERSRK